MNLKKIIESGHSAHRIGMLISEQSFNDYPKAAKDQAQKALDFKDEHGDEVKAGTQVGWTRANQIAKGENLSLDTLKRIKAFFDRHEENKALSNEFRDTPWKDNGYVSWLLWGGDPMYRWVKDKLSTIEEVVGVTAGYQPPFSEGDEEELEEYIQTYTATYDNGSRT